MTGQLISQLSSVVFLAFAISLDAFSISLGYGLQHPRLKRILQLSLLIGLFHMLLPLIGILLGQFITVKIGQFAIIASSVLLLLVGFHMFFSSFTSPAHERAPLTVITMISLAFVVSIDSFSVGLSLGMLGSVTLVTTLLLFGLISITMTMLGLLLGRKINRYIGTYSEILGGAILTSFGLHMLLGI